MIEGLNNTDKKIVAHLLPLRGDSTKNICKKIMKTRTYTFQRLQYLNSRGLVLQSIKGKIASWFINPSVKIALAKTVGITLKELKTIAKLQKQEDKQNKKAQAEKMGRAFEWGNAI